MGKNFVEFTEVINRCRKNHVGSYACYSEDDDILDASVLTQSDCYTSGGQWLYSGSGDAYIDYPGYPQTKDRVVDINDITGYELALNCNKTINTSNVIIQLGKLGKDTKGKTGNSFETNITPANFKIKLAKWFS